MTDLAVLAFGFGVMPLAAILLYAFPETVLRHREASWGILAGVTGFLGLSHAMALVLVNHSLLGDRTLATILSDRLPISKIPVAKRRKKRKA